MSLRVHRLLRVALNVGDLQASAAFYEDTLGFAAGPASDCDPAVARLLGADRGRSIQLVRGGQVIELTALDPPGAPYPPDSRSNDLWFQHCALTTADMAAACARLSDFAVTPISRAGPQRLPANTGGVTAFKFRDPDGHPLELIAFPDRPAADSIDHSAIAVSDVARSIAFYRALGLRLGSQGVNTGAEQDALDGLHGVHVDVVALMPDVAAPHVELLGYRTPPGRRASVRPADIAASRLVLAATGLAAHPGAVGTRDGGWAALLHDPDGHGLLLVERA
jgi:catechol 2,3-dioxygenase-like lactoylglutathione lyase family enzyme